MQVRKVVPFVLSLAFIGMPVITYLYSGVYDEYVVGVVVIIVSVSLFFRKPVKLAGFEWMFLVFLAFCIANTVLRIDRVSSKHCLTLLLTIAMYCYGKRCSDGYKKVGLSCVIFVASFHSTLMILQYVGIIPSLSYYFKVSSVYGNPAPPSVITVLGFVALLYLKGDEKRGWGFYMTVVLMALAIILSSSRTAMLSFGVCCIYDILDRRGIRKGVFVIMAVMCMIPLFYIIRPYSADVRLLIWRSSIGMVRENPLLGSGMESFASDYMIYQAKYFSGHPDSCFIMLAANHNRAYNEFIRILCEEGVVGLVLFLGSIVWMLETSGGLTRLVMVSAISSLFLYTFDITEWVGAVAFLVGLLQEGVKDTEGEIKFYRCFVVGSMLLVVFFMVHPIPQRHSICYEDALEKGISAWQEKNYAEAEENFTMAFHMIPSRIAAPYLLFDMYREINEDKAAIMAEKIVSFGEYKNEGNATLRMKHDVKVWLQAFNREGEVR